MKINFKPVNNILIRSVNWIGDAVMTTPAISLLREFFPTAKISILANPLVSELFRSDPRIDEVITFHRNGRHKGFTGRIRLAMEIRKRSFDMVVIFPNSFDSASVPWLAGIPVRIGKRGDGRTLLLTHSFNKNELPTGVHQSIQYTSMLNIFGITGKSYPQSLFISKDVEISLNKRLENEGISENDFLICVNPGATYGSAKRWYPERFAESARILAERWKAKIVVTGGKDEKRVAADIVKALGGECINLAAETSIPELMALLKRADFVITNDSGPMHIAAAFDVPLVAIFGSTDNATTFPLSDRAVVVRHPVDCAPCMKRECIRDHECMKGVTVEMVVEAAIKLYFRSYI